MKDLAQICLAMAEAGIRLQTGEDLAAVHTRHPGVEGDPAMQPERPVGMHGLERDPATTAE